MTSTLREFGSVIEVTPDERNGLEENHPLLSASTFDRYQ
jgi:hypothetical protein